MKDITTFGSKIQLEYFQKHAIIIIIIIIIHIVFCNYTFYHYYETNRMIGIVVPRQISCSLKHMLYLYATLYSASVLWFGIH